MDKIYMQINAFAYSIKIILIKSNKDITYYIQVLHTWFLRLLLLLFFQTNVYRLKDVENTMM